MSAVLRLVSTTVRFMCTTPATKTYGTGVAWNGITAISEKPEGAEATDLYADNILYSRCSRLRS